MYLEYKVLLNEEASNTKDDKKYYLKLILKYSEVVIL